MIRSKQKAGGFTLVELLVVIGIISILVAILMPALTKAREQGNAVVCLSNLRQLGLTMIMYANDNKNAVLPATPWDPPFPRTYTGDRSFLGLLWEYKYFRNKFVTRCPSDKVVTAGDIHGAYSFGPSSDGDDGKSSYGLNYFGFRLDYTTLPGLRRQDVKFPDETYWVSDNSDAPGVWGGGVFYDPVNYLWPRRHGLGINMLWADGHASWISDKTVCMHGYYATGAPPGTQRWDDVP